MEIVGTKIDRYDIREHIGEGGMAQVYRAFDPEINRTLAMKILKDEHCKDEERTSRFLKEGKAAGALTHPNIVTVYDVGKLDGVPYIMMELLEGENLGDVLQAGTKLSMEAITTIAMQLANALDYAHSKGVVHRDMKPENIMLGDDGETVKIADFGIARVEEHSDKDSTQVGMMMGTPRYMSPEQVSGARVDGRSDLFAVGVILYEMITGKKAFDAESMPTLITQIVQKNPLPIRQISTGVPVGLQKIVGKLLQKKPEKRFQSGQELYQALERERLTLREAEEETARYLPLQVKWTAIMSAVVALAMALSSIFVFQAQSNVVTHQAIDGGISLSKFVAVQAAIPLLGEDWVTLESFVEDAAARETFRYLIVYDHTGVVRSASDPTLVGQDWQQAQGGEVLYSMDKVEVTDLGDVFSFTLPVLFNETVVGGVNMGLDTQRMNAALATTQRMLVALGFSVVLAVSVAIYIFNKLMAKKLLLAIRALRLFGQGQLETRISRQSSDEFGELFGAFNSMADAVEKQLDAPSPVDGGGPDGLATPALTEIDVSGITHAAVDEMTVVRASDDDDAKA